MPTESDPHPRFEDYRLPAVLDSQAGLMTAEQEAACHANIVAHFAARDFEEIQKLYGGRDAWVYVAWARGRRELAQRYNLKDVGLLLALAPRGYKVAIRVIAPYAVKRPRNRATLGNRLRSKLLPRLLPRHPNLVRYLGSGVFHWHDAATGARVPLPYLVMEFIEGRNLSALLPDPAFRAGGVTRIRTVTVGILEGLAALYRRGLRHGDLSPSNVILETGTYWPVLVDLRLSTRLFRRLARDRADIHRTLREMLAGRYELSREPSAAAREAAWQFWSAAQMPPAEQDAFKAWLDFVDSMATGGALSAAQPPAILKAAKALARRQELEPQMNADKEGSGLAV